MPKRKAGETSDDDAVGVPVGETAFSPNAIPRKKSKKEALAAARDWHDARSTSSAGAVASAGRPNAACESASESLSARSSAKKGKKEALAAARDWHDARRSSTTPFPPVVPARTDAVGGARAAAAQPRTIASSTYDGKGCAPRTRAAPVGASVVERMHEDAAASTQSELHRDATTATKGGGRNAFLKSLRAAMEGDDKISASNTAIATATNTTTTASTTPSMGGSGTRSSSDVVYPAARECIGIVGRAIVCLILFALNIATAIVAIVVIRASSSSFDALRERHASEVVELETGLAKSREVEALLRSGVRVLEREMMARGDAGRESDVADVRAMYGIRPDAGTDDDDDDSKYILQSREERNDWLEGMRVLEGERKMGMEKLQATRMALFKTGRFRWDEDGTSPN